MKKNNSIYLKDMLEAISKIEKFTKDLDFAAFKNDDRTQFAVFHSLEIVGEASNKLSKSFVENNSKLPIKEAIELRNFLIYGYDQVSPSIVWKTIKENLPPLKKTN